MTYDYLYAFINNIYHHQVFDKLSVNVCVDPAVPIDSVQSFCVLLSVFFRLNKRKVIEEIDVQECL